MRTILLSFDEKWYPVLKSGEKIFEHRRKFCNEEVCAFLYLGKPRQQIVAEIGLGKRELLEDWLQQYQKEKEVADRISDFMRRNKFAMKVLWFKEIEPINLLAIGYADGEAKSPDRHDKDRKALSDIILS